MTDLRADTYLARNPLSARAYMASRFDFYWNTGRWPEQRIQHRPDYVSPDRLSMAALALLCARHRKVK